MEQVFTHPSMSTFHGQQGWSWQKGRKLWQNVGNTRHVRNSKQDIFKISQPFRKYGYWWSYSFVQRNDTFQKYIPKKHKRFLSNYTNYATGYTKVCLGKDRKSMATQLTATHSRVAEIIRKAEGCGHKLYKDNYFSPMNFYMVWQWKKINCWETVQINKDGTPEDLRCKTVELGREDIQITTRGDITTTQ